MDRTQVSLDDLRAEIDEWMLGFLAERGAALPEANELIAEIRRIVAAGGKRLRPAFCYWGYRASGAAHSDAIVGASASFELLHTFAIVHDDIMDSATERRGQPSTLSAMGISRALLVGDLALVLADAAFWGSGFEADVLAPAFADFTTMREQVIAGQLLDISAHEGPVDEARARAIAILKSGSYSIENPLLIGARLGGVDDGTRAAFAVFGRPLGEAFQLRDDLLGVFGDPTLTGKPADSDIREGKRNVLFAKTLGALTGDERTWFESNWGRPDLDAGTVERLRSLVDSSGARAATEDLVHELGHAAADALAGAEIDAGARSALTELMDIAIRRTS